MNLDDFPRIPLAFLPTPLDDAPRLAKSIGLDRLLIKRDDNTGLALGGNKARKLEYLVAEAMAAKADVLITCGGPQSNHARMTAAAARKVGMDCIILMPRAEMPEVFEGNLLLDAVLGAEMRFLPDTPFIEFDGVMAEEEARLIAQGRTPYVIPMGGSTALADLGYVNASRELSDQLGELSMSEVDMVTAVGSGGTIAGLVLGCHMFQPKSTLIGVSVLWKNDVILPKVIAVANDAAKLVGVECDLDLDRVKMYDEYIGKGYGIPTAGCEEAILLASRMEGLILDPVYTGKAMAGLINLARKGEIGQERPVVFWHTGGAPGLFAFEKVFHDEAVRLAGA